MQKALTVSIVIPVFNEERYLKACLDSIAAQSVAPDEVIVVNNNSTDDTVKILQAYPCVKVIHEPKQGIVHARNAGFNAAACDIIGRIDADTVLPVNWVELVKQFYADQTAFRIQALTGGGYFYNLRAPNVNGWVQGQLAFRMNRLIMGHYIVWGSNMALPKHLWDDVKAKTCDRQDIHEDLDLAIHLHRKNYQITYHESLRVGACMKRVWSDRDKQAEHRARWPRTLKVHGNPFWWMGTLGNILLVAVVNPYVQIAEFASRYILRKPPLR